MAGDRSRSGDRLPIYLAAAGRIALAVGVLWGATWWFRLPGWSLPDGCAEGADVCEGFAFDVALRPATWFVTVTTSAAVLVAGRALRPSTIGARLPWGAAIVGSVLIANLRSPVWAAVVAACGVLIVAGLPAPLVRARRAR